MCFESGHICFPQKDSYALIYGAVSPIARIHGSRNERVEMEVAPLTITRSDSLTKLSLLISTSYVLLAQRYQFQMEEQFNLWFIEYANDLLNWKFRLPPGHFALLMPLNEQTQKGVTAVAGVINPDCQGEIGLLLYIRHKGDCIWNTGDLLSHVLVLPCSVIEINGKL